MTARPIWLTREQVEALGKIRDGQHALRPLVDLLNAWDAAPADPAEAVAAKLNDIDLDPAFRDQPWYVVAPHVLRALGMPA